MDRGFCTNQNGQEADLRGSGKFREETLQISETVPYTFLPVSLYRMRVCVCACVVRVCACARMRAQ